MQKLRIFLYLADHSSARSAHPPHRRYENAEPAGIVCFLSDFDTGISVWYNDTSYFHMELRGAPHTFCNGSERMNGYHFSEEERKNI